MAEGGHRPFLLLLFFSIRSLLPGFARDIFPWQRWLMPSRSVRRRHVPLLQFDRASLPLSDWLWCGWKCWRGLFHFLRGRGTEAPAAESAVVGPPGKRCMADRAMLR